MSILKKLKKILISIFDITAYNKYPSNGTQHPI